MLNKHTINCRACEVRVDVIVRQANYDEVEEVEVNYCPVCSTPIEDYEWVNEEDEDEV